MRELNPRFVEVDANNEIHLLSLFLLLRERTVEQSISHKRMPTFDEHRHFVKSKPYRHWYLIQVDDPDVGPSYAGATYLTYDNEIGIFIFSHYVGQGFGEWAVKEIMATHAGPFLANVSPKNFKSQRFFQRLGFDFIQYTYRHE